ncbi:MAG: hypothetical protein ABR968_09895 [Bacteroidales bacterium]|jgi:hypothetical protein
MLRLNKVPYIISLLIILLIAYYSCKRETITPVDVGYGYFPTNVGHWVLYQVDSTHYDSFSHGKATHFHYQIKELIQSTFLDLSNRTTQRIERYETMDTIPIFLKDVWVSNLTNIDAEKVEENIRYIKLVFPVTGSQTWNGNAYNTFEAQDYQYANVNVPYTINGLSFDSTVTVIQDTVFNLIEDLNEYEIYAKHVGLIYKRYRNVGLFPDINHPDSIIGGVDYSYKIISFGN